MADFNYKQSLLISVKIKSINTLTIMTFNFKQYSIKLPNNGLNKWDDVILSWNDNNGIFMINVSSMFLQ